MHTISLVILELTMLIPGALVTGQVSVSSSAAASTAHSGVNGPQAYISSLSSSNAKPNYTVKILPVLTTTKPLPTRRITTRLPASSSRPTSPVPVATTAAPTRPTNSLVSKSSWDYRPSEDLYGPDKWHLLSERCKGQRQSPINIITTNTVPEAGANYPFKLIRPKSGQPFNLTIKGKLKNNGKALGFEVDANNDPIKIAFRGTYTLTQFHFHFGCENNSGSEHLLDGKHFPGEIHFFFNNDKYNTAEDMIQAADGILALAFFLEIDESVQNSEFNKINQLLPEVKLPKEKEVVEGGIDLTKLVPALKEGIRNLRWFAYKGSLPAPPCFESVVWVVFPRPVKVKNRILDEWRKELEGTKFRMCGNRRPVQPLNGRRLISHSSKPPPTIPVQATTTAPLG